MIVWPPIAFFAVLTVFAIASFALGLAIAGQAANSPDGVPTAGGLLLVAKIVRVLFGFLGLVTVVGGPISIVYGIYLLAKGDQPVVPGITPQPPQPKI